MFTTSMHHSTVERQSVTTNLRQRYAIFHLCLTAGSTVFISAFALWDGFGLGLNCIWPWT